MIKIGIRKNLLYPLIFVISTFLIKIEQFIMQISEIHSFLLSILLKFLSEFLGGIIIYKYQVKTSKKNISKKEEKLYGMHLIYNKSHFNKKDNDTIIGLLILAIAFLDFIKSYISNVYILKRTINIKYDFLILLLSSTMIIFASFFSYLLLNIQLYRHHKVSLIIIFFGLIITIILEYIDNFGNNFIILTYFLILIFIANIFDSFKDIIEKYLLQYNNINSFQMLKVEGLFGLILTGVYCFLDNPFKINTRDKIKIFIFLICSFIDFILNGCKNIYRVETNRLFSPTVIAITDTIFVPGFIIYRKNNFSKNLYFYY